MMTKGIGNMMGFQRVFLYCQPALQKLGESIGMCFESLGSGIRINKKQAFEISQ